MDGSPPARSRAEHRVGSGAKPLKAGDKYGFSLYRNTLKNTKLTNTEINTMTI